MKLCGRVVLFAEVIVPQFWRVDVAACAAVVAFAELKHFIYDFLRRDYMVNQ